MYIKKHIYDDVYKMIKECIFVKISKLWNQVNVQVTYIFLSFHDTRYQYFFFLFGSGSEFLFILPFVIFGGCVIRSRNYPSFASAWFTPSLWWRQCYSVSSFMLMLCRSLLCPFFFRPLHFMFFLDLRILITPSVSSNPYCYSFWFCSFFLLLVFVMRRMYPMLSVSLDCPFLIATSFGFI